MMEIGKIKFLSDIIYSGNFSETEHSLQKKIPLLLNRKWEFKWEFQINTAL